MRMRKDTGFFRIKVNNGTVNTILPNLSAEDFLGEVVETASGLLVVTFAADNEARTTVTFTAGEGTYTYTRATGAIVVGSNP